jgi:hypothetical protein
MTYSSSDWGSWPMVGNTDSSSSVTKAFVGFVWKVDCVWNMMAHAQKPDSVFRRNGRVQLSWRGRQFGRLLAAELCTSAVVMLDTRCSEAVWRVLAYYSIRQFPLHFLSRESPCAITFQPDSNAVWGINSTLGPNSAKFHDRKTGEKDWFLPLATHTVQRPVCKCSRGAVRASWKRGGVSSNPVASADADNKQRLYIIIAERVRENYMGWRFAKTRC